MISPVASGPLSGWIAFGFGPTMRRPTSGSNARVAAGLVAFMGLMASYPVYVATRGSKVRWDRTWPAWHHEQASMHVQSCMRDESVSDRDGPLPPMLPRAVASQRAGPGWGRPDPGSLRQHGLQGRRPGPCGAHFPSVSGRAARAPARHGPAPGRRRPGGATSACTTQLILQPPRHALHPSPLHMLHA